MMARANVWVCFGTSEDPTKLFGIHEQAIDAKHLGQLLLSVPKTLCCSFHFTVPPWNENLTAGMQNHCENTVESIPLFLWVFTNIQFHNVSQILHNPIFAHCSCQRFSGKQCSWQGGSDTPPNLVRILPTSTRDEIHKSKCRAIFLMFLL